MNQFNEKEIIEFIKENYGKISQNNIMKELHISNGKLIKYAKQLNIYKPKEKNIVIDEDVLNYIKKNYKKMGAIEISKKLNCSEKVIYKYAKKLELTNCCNIWDNKEKNLLKKYYQSCPLKGMKKILKNNGYERTEKAIEGMAKKLKIYKDPTFKGEYLLTKDIMDIMNFSKSKVNKLFLSNKIESRIYKRKRQVTIEQFIKYLKNHQNTWNCKLVDLNYIKTICSTQNISINKINKNNFEDIFTPEWLENKIIVDFSTKIKQKKEWTTQEISKLLEYKKNKYSYSDIAIKMNRSYESIYKKISETEKNLK